MRLRWGVLILALQGCATGGGYAPAQLEVSGLTVTMVPRPTSDFVVLEVTARNPRGEDLVLSLSDFVVLDSDRFALRRMEPHEAANMVLRQVKGAPTYRPKWEIRAESDRVVIEEARSNSPTEAFAEAFAEAFRNSGDRYWVEKADEVYAEGLAERTVVPARAGVRGWAYYLGSGKGLVVRAGDVEVAFRR